MLLVFVAASYYMPPPSSISYVVGDPEISGNSASITYPPGYQGLAQYALDLINQDRATLGYHALVLSPIGSGEQHADSMLYFGYFSHWDPQGLKPYMRYSALNGTGSVFENVAWQHSQDPGYTSLADIKSALFRMNFQMMYDDSYSNWEHRANILNPDHDRVSIGVAYGSQDVFFVEDFEDNSVNLTAPLALLGSQVNLTATLASPLSDGVLQVYYDPLASVDVGSLRNDSRYTGSYDLGTLIGVVLPTPSTPYLSPAGALTLYALSWQQGPSSLKVVFSLEALTQKCGKGVYTVYLQLLTGQQLLGSSLFFGG